MLDISRAKFYAWESFLKYRGSRDLARDSERELSPRW
jgi:hypothetical protein